MKSLRMSQKSFLDNKKITIDFPYVGRGGGQPTYGEFHMFRRFFLNESFPYWVNNTQYPANIFYSNKYIHIKFRLNFNNEFQTWKMFGALHTRR